MMMQFGLSYCKNERESKSYFELVFGNLSVKIYHSHSIYLQRKKKEEKNPKRKKIEKSKTKNEKIERPQVFERHTDVES
jgi:hypothetical protein